MTVGILCCAVNKFLRSRIFCKLVDIFAVYRDIIKSPSLLPREPCLRILICYFPTSFYLQAYCACFQVFSTCEFVLSSIFIGFLYLYWLECLFIIIILTQHCIIASLFYAISCIITFYVLIILVGNISRQSTIVISTVSLVHFEYPNFRSID